MPTKPYIDSKGKRLPGVTTVIGSNLGWKAGGLIHWAWEEGMAGRDYRDTKGKAADIGTLVHACIDAELHGKPLPDIPSDFQESVDNALLSWATWRDSMQFMPVQTELSLLDEELGYGGTMDLVSVMGSLTVSDYKTSKGIYPDHIIQLAAYGNLWTVNHPDKPLGGYSLLRVDKEDASFHYHHWHNLDKAWDAFKHLLALHGLKKLIK